jgi:hypothetical protein
MNVYSELISIEGVEELETNDPVMQRIDKLEIQVNSISEMLKKLLLNRQYEERRNTGYNEISATDKLYHILNKHLHGLVKSNMKDFYGVSKKQSGYITEFDGLFILNRRGNIFDPLAKTIVVESKTTLSIQKINIKLQQMMIIKRILQQIQDGKIRLEQSPKPFREMIETYNVRAFPLDIYVIFSPKHFTKETKEYFELLQNGEMTEEKYVNYCISILKEKYFDDVIRDTKEDKSVQKLIQEILKKKTVSIEEFNTFYSQFMILPIPHKKCIAFIELCPSYESMIPVFETFKGKLGFFYNDKLESYLTLSPAGGKRKTRKVKK